ARLLDRPEWPVEGPEPVDRRRLPARAKLGLVELGEDAVATGVSEHLEECAQAVTLGRIANRCPTDDSPLFDDGPDVILIARVDPNASAKPAWRECILAACRREPDRTHDPGSSARSDGGCDDVGEWEPKRPVHAERVVADLPLAVHAVVRSGGKELAV